MTNTAHRVPEPALAEGWRVAHRTIFRADQALDIRPLYVEGISDLGGGTSTARQSGASASDEDEEEREPISARGGSTSDISVDDGGVTVAAGRHVTFGTYFNAFPASYWRRWTDFSSVRLAARVRGHGTVIVYRSTAKGHVQRVDDFLVESDEVRYAEFDLTLAPFIDGGWYWFDIEASDGSCTLEEAVWAFPTERQRSGTVSIGITTFNRPDYCVDQLVQLADEPDVLDVLDEILVVDQGTQKVSEHEVFADAAARLGTKLRVIEQGNLGGSGGFARAMAETAGNGRSDYVLLLDDDVVCEPQGILRAVTFADLAKQPLIVGGHMLSLYDRSVLHAFGETVDRYRWFWGPAPDTQHGHNFARKPLRGTPWLHRRVDVDYNGWWMCLIPTQVVRDVGLPLPMFIKWDDAEYGLRAAKAGVPTVSMPGVAVWHVPWHEKDDTIDWQAYFHRRNRLVAALLHSPYPRGGRLVRASFETEVKHIVSMQYGPAEMGLLAVQDVLEGPDRMHRDMRERLPELQRLRKQFDDSRSEPTIDAFPVPRRQKPPRKGKVPTAPTNRLEALGTVVAGTVRQFMPPRDLAGDHPERMVSHADSRWWLLSQYDSALVSSADGTSAAWYRRDRAQARDLLARSVALHTRLARDWHRLSEKYRSALPELTSDAQWRKTFGEEADGS